MRRLAPWIVAVLLLGGATAGIVAAANATVFSATSFVRVYLDALERGDATTAAAMPGVDTRGLDTAAIDGAALSRLAVRSVVEHVDDRGLHRITVRWSSAGHEGSTVLTVEPAASPFGVLSGWRFARSPVAAMTVSTTGDLRYLIGRADARASARAVALLVPGAYSLSMDGKVAEAPADTVLAAEPGGRLAMRLSGSATEGFTAETTTVIRHALAECATRHVLYPPGCPFGASIVDRISSEPKWTIAAYPTVQLSPTSTPGVWSAIVSGGSAQLTVDVTSLYDGSVSTRTIAASIQGVWRIVVVGDSPELAGLVGSG